MKFLASFLDWIAIFLVVLGMFEIGWIFLMHVDFISVLLGPAVGLHHYLDIAIGLSAIYLAATFLLRAKNRDRNPNK